MTCSSYQLTLKTLLSPPRGQVRSILRIVSCLQSELLTELYETQVNRLGLRSLKLMKLYGLVRAMSGPQLIRIEVNTWFGKGPLSSTLLVSLLTHNFKGCTLKQLSPLPPPSFSEETRTCITQLLAPVGTSLVHAH